MRGVPPHDRAVLFGFGAGEVIVVYTEVESASLLLAFVDVANRIFEVTGSSSTHSDVVLDLFWCNVRTHSLHDPVDYKKSKGGAYFLRGESQPLL